MFTKHLLAALEEPGASLKDVFERTRAEVYAASGKKQRPAIYDEVIGRLVLREGKREERTEVAVLPKVDEEEVYFGECKERKGAFCEVYLKRYPKGKYADLAGLYLGEGKKAEVLAPPVVGASRVEAGELPAGTKRQGPDGLMYVWIPKGSFMMGCSPGDKECDANEKPAKRMEISRGFWIGETETTQGAYERLTGQNPSQFKAVDRPVEKINWHQARVFCGKTGGRLPSEEEWEYAARGGSTGARPGPLDQVA